MILNDIQKDAITEIVNIGVGYAASMLSDLVKSSFTLKIPEIRLITNSELQIELEEFQDSQINYVDMKFMGPVSGKTFMMFSMDSAIKLIASVTGEDINSPHLNLMKIGTLTEIGNIVINGIMGSIGDTLNKHLKYSLPNYHEDNFNSIVQNNFC